MITFITLLITMLIIAGIVVFGGAIAGSIFLVAFADLIACGAIMYGIYKLLKRKK